MKILAILLCLLVSAPALAKISGVSPELQKQLDDIRKQRCRNYGLQATWAAKANSAMGCGGTGNRYLLDNKAHEAWCLTAPDKSSIDELLARRDFLKACVDSHSK